MGDPAVNAKEFGAELDECKRSKGANTVAQSSGSPFWLRITTQNTANYPGFELSCTENNDTFADGRSNYSFFNCSVSPRVKVPLAQAAMNLQDRNCGL
ncbi:hypothetical protein FCV25MIE_02692 [Fagus crenata]